MFRRLFLDHPATVGESYAEHFGVASRFGLTMIKGGLGALVHAVVPAPSGLSAFFQRNAAPPQACTSIPRCALYQAPSAFGSFALKKIPPMPVTRFI